MIIAVVLVAVWIVIDAVGGDELTAATPPPQTETQTVESEPATPTSEPTPTPVNSPKGDKPEKKPDKKPPERKDDGLITADITVQVLNGTGATTADDRMADRLSSLGYEVVAIDGSSKQYGRTTVFWSFPAERA